MSYTVHGILQARIMEWVAFPFSRVSSQPRDQTQVSHITGRFFTSWTTREAQEYCSGQRIPSPGSSQPRNQTGVPCIAGGFFTNWAVREALTLSQQMKKKQQYQNMAHHKGTKTSKVLNKILFFLWIFCRLISKSFNVLLLSSSFYC